VLAVASIVGLFAIFTLLAPENGGPGKLVALHRFLPRMGIQVTDAEEPPPSGTYLLPLDRRTSEQEDELIAWASAGGRLVVTDPGSPLLARYDMTTSRVGIVGSTLLETDCVRAETQGVSTLDVDPSDRILSHGPELLSCFGDASSGYVVFIPTGSGEVIFVGGSSFLTDERLQRADDAAFALGVLERGPVVIGPPTVDDGTVGLWSTLPPDARAAIWELAIATALFALARARRLGRPVPEEPLSPIPSGELVLASARLYRLGGAQAHCALLLRRWTADRLARRLGLGPDADPADLAPAVARATGRRLDAVEASLTGPDPVDGRGLVALARELEVLSESIEGAER
jgi:hypothetical protein